MNPYVITLILISTVMHAGWNLLARYQRSEARFFSRMLTVVVLVGFVPGILSEAFSHSLNSTAWVCVLGSGSFCALYFFCLARAYSASDFTTVYPVARAMPVFLVGLGDVARGIYPTAIGWIGMLLVIAGCFLAPLTSFRDFRARSYLNRTSVYMLLTAVGTVGYTLLDKIASELVVQGPATAARYGYLYFLISFVAYRVLLRIFRREGQESHAVGWRFPFYAAFLTFGAYWLILWAYQLSRYASYVVAFRQFSIVIGVILGFAIYKEQGLVVRAVGTFMITLGLVLVGLWGG
jgi:drug/metabolite transporter (DMT)-like permease